MKNIYINSGHNKAFFLKDYTYNKESDKLER